MTRYCHFRSCKNIARRNKDITFFKLPTDPQIRRLWLKMCGNGDLKLKYFYVCHLHFRQDDFIRDIRGELMGETLKRRIKPTAVPVLKPEIDPELPKNETRRPGSKLKQRHLIAEINFARQKVSESTFNSKVASEKNIQSASTVLKDEPQKLKFSRVATTETVSCSSSETVNSKIDDSDLKNPGSLKRVYKTKPTTSISNLLPTVLPQLNNLNSSCASLSVLNPVIPPQLPVTGSCINNMVIIPQTVSPMTLANLIPFQLQTIGSNNAFTFCSLSQNALKCSDVGNTKSVTSLLHPVSSNILKKSAAAFSENSASSDPDDPEMHPDSSTQQDAESADETTNFIGKLDTFNIQGNEPLCIITEPNSIEMINTYKSSTTTKLNCLNIQSISESKTAISEQNCLEGIDIIKPFPEVTILDSFLSQGVDKMHSSNIKLLSNTENFQSGLTLETLNNNFNSEHVSIEPEMKGSAQTLLNLESQTNLQLASKTDKINLNNISNLKKSRRKKCVKIVDNSFSGKMINHINNNQISEKKVTSKQKTYKKLHPKKPPIDIGSLFKETVLDVPGNYVASYTTNNNSTLDNSGTPYRTSLPAKSNDTDEKLREDLLTGQKSLQEIKHFFLKNKNGKCFEEESISSVSCTNFKGKCCRSIGSQQGECTDSVLHNLAGKNNELELKLKKAYGIIRKLEVEKNEIRKQVSNQNKTVDAEIRHILKKCFTAKQISYLMSNNKMCMWDEETLVKAVALRAISKRAYIFLKDELKIPLPSLQSIKRFLAKQTKPSLIDNALMSSLNDKMGSEDDEQECVEIAYTSQVQDIQEDITVTISNMESDNNRQEYVQIPYSSPVEGIIQEDIPTTFSNAIQTVNTVEGY